MLYWQFNFHLACVVAFLSLIPFPFSRVHAMIRRFQSYTQLMHFGLNFISFHFLRLQIKIYEQRAALCMCSAQCHQNVYIDCSYGLQLLFALPLSFFIILLVECTHRCNTIVLVHRFFSFICIANTLIHALFALSTCLPCFASTAEKKKTLFSSMAFILQSLSRFSPSPRLFECIVFKFFIIVLSTFPPFFSLHFYYYCKFYRLFLMYVQCACTSRVPFIHIFFLFLSLSICYYY